MLLDDIKKRMMAAMKAQDTVLKEVLRTAIGEVTARGSDVTDDDVLAVLKKLVKSNEETLKHTTDATQKATLEREIAIVRDLLPKGPSVDELIAKLAESKDAIAAAKNDGQATGVASKFLKSVGVTADGKDVAEAVKRMRAGAQ